MLASAARANRVVLSASALVAKMAEVARMQVVAGTPLAVRGEELVLQVRACGSEAVVAMQGAMLEAAASVVQVRVARQAAAQAGAPLSLQAMQTLVDTSAYEEADLAIASPAAERRAAALAPARGAAVDLAIASQAAAWRAAALALARGAAVYLEVGHTLASATKVKAPAKVQTAARRATNIAGAAQTVCSVVVPRQSYTERSYLAHAV